MLRSPTDSRSSPSQFQAAPWCSSVDVGAPQGGDNKSSSMTAAAATAACWYPSPWPYTYGAMPSGVNGGAVPLVLPFGSSSSPVCRLPAVPWAANCGWPPLPAVPAPVVLSPTGPLSLPTPSTVGLEQTSHGLPVTASAASHPRIIANMPMTASPGLSMIGQPSLHYDLVPVDARSAATSDSTELKTPELGRRHSEPSRQGGQSVSQDDESDGEDVEVDVEGSVVSDGKSGSGSSCSPQLSASQGHHRIGDIDSQSPTPHDRALSSHDQVEAGEARTKQVSCLPHHFAQAAPRHEQDSKRNVTLSSAPGLHSSETFQVNHSSLVSVGRGGRRPLLPDINQGQVRLAFNVTRGQGSPEHGCSVCGTLSCGSRSANRGPDNPPRRQYFSCKVARRRLLEWIDLHKDHPYPTKAQRAQLLKDTGMNRVQLQNWLGNHRRRLKAQKAIEDGREVATEDDESS